MKRYIFLVLCLANALLVSSQINPQRPSLSESYDIIQHNGFQFENGFDLSASNIVVDGLWSTTTNTFIRKRIGASKWEARYFTTYESTWASNHLGVKRVLTSGDKWLNASIMGSTNLMFTTTDIRFSVTADVWKLSLTGNAGYTNGRPYWIGILGAGITDKTSIFAEVQDLRYYNFGLVNRRADNICIDARVLYDQELSSVITSVGLSFIL